MRKFSEVTSALDFISLQPISLPYIFSAQNWHHPNSSRKSPNAVWNNSCEAPENSWPRAAKKTNRAFSTICWHTTRRTSRPKPHYITASASQCTSAFAVHPMCRERRWFVQRKCAIASAPHQERWWFGTRRISSNWLCLFVSPTFSPTTFHWRNHCIR